MQVISVLLTKYEYRKIKELNPEGSLTEKLAHFIDKEEELFNALTWGTNGKWNIDTTYKEISDFFEININK
jgi:hypothetical protein